MSGRTGAYRHRGTDVTLPRRTQWRSGRVRKRFASATSSRKVRRWTRRPTTAHVVDSDGNFSQQIDVVIFDRQYSPFIFTYENETIIPAESVYAVFEAKQTADAGLVAYAQEKVASVRRLRRTSLPIPYAKGVYPAKPLIPILGGLLTSKSEWSPPLGPFLLEGPERKCGRGSPRYRLRRFARPLLLRSSGCDL